MDGSTGRFQPSEQIEPSGARAALQADQEQRRLLEEILTELRDMKNMFALQLPQITGSAMDAGMPMSSQTS